MASCSIAVSRDTFFFGNGIAGMVLGTFRSIRVTPRMAETIQSLNDKAVALRAQGRLREAVALFSEAIVQYPQAAVLYNNLALTLDEIGSPKDAMIAYDSALSRAPKFVASLIGKAGLLLRDARVDEARHLFAEALDVEPSSVAANLGMY